MKTRLLDLLDALRSSYWFIPGLMTLAAGVLAFATTAADEVLGTTWVDSVGWLYANRPEGARTILGTISGSAISVAGVTFSVTIASYVYATGQYGPRLLTNFMADTGSKVTLGTLLGTFLYGLLVLRTIRAADEPALGSSAGAGVTGEAMAAFVPHLSILVALGLGVASLAALIYFVHHVPQSIHVSNVVAGIGRELRERLDAVFPEHVGQGGPTADGDEEDDRRVSAEADLPDAFYADAAAVRAERTGYVQSLDAEAVLDVAARHDVLVRLRYRPGDFVAEGDALVLVGPGARLDARAARQLRRAFAVGRSRTPFQDERFLVNELVEVAARALSPAVNDPFTAVTCLDWLGAALRRVAARPAPSALRRGPDGRVRVVAEPTAFGAFAEAAFGQLRPYVAADRNAALHAFRVLGEVGGQTSRATCRQALARESDALAAACDEALVHQTDRALVRGRHAVVARVLRDRDSYEAIASETDWLGGSA